MALTFSDEEITCPLDGTKFEFSGVASFTQRGYRLDWKPFGALRAPMPLPVCPTNGFVMYKRKYTEQEVVSLRRIVTSDAYQQARRRHTDYYMVAFIQERMGADVSEIAYSYLKAGWEVERRDPTLMNHYFRLCLKKLDEFLDDKIMYDEDWWESHLLAANLERRLGEFEAATRRLDDASSFTLLKNSIQEVVESQIRHWVELENDKPQRLDLNMEMIDPSLLYDILDHFLPIIVLVVIPWTILLSIRRLRRYAAPIIVPFVVLQVLFLYAIWSGFLTPPDSARQTLQHVMLHWLSENPLLLAVILEVLFVAWVTIRKVAAPLSAGRK